MVSSDWYHSSMSMILCQVIKKELKCHCISNRHINWIPQFPGLNCQMCNDVIMQDSIYPWLCNCKWRIRTWSGSGFINLLGLWQNGRHLADSLNAYVHQWNVWIAIKISQLLSQGSDWQNASIGSDVDLAPNRRQAIIWTNDGLWYRRTDESLGVSELRQ